MFDIPEILVCICTYKRPHLLATLLEDLEKQTLLPQRILAVDGDPESNQVPEILQNKVQESRAQYHYIPSNHANLAYQRYLGWRHAQSEGVDILLYLDDDLRITDSRAIEELIKPFREDKVIAGVTTRILFGDPKRLEAYPHLQERASGSLFQPLLVSAFGSSRNVPAGGLTPTGHRKMPESKEGEKYSKIEWLRGGVMAVAMSCLTQECFTEDLFAMTHIGCGLGEDTLLSHRLSFKGRLLMVDSTQVIHPHEDAPNSYPVHPYRFGFATAYSRRLLNDYYRGFEPPRLRDRMALVKSYLGHIVLSLWRVVRRPLRHRLLYMAGYFAGSIRGLFCPPRAERLTPQIHWFKDANQAVAQARVIGGEG